LELADNPVNLDFGNTAVHDHAGVRFPSHTRAPFSNWTGFMIFNFAVPDTQIDPQAKATN